jgi:hypothetical protein
MRDATHCDIVYEKGTYRCNTGGGSGLYYKIGKRNMVFRWNGTEWVRSTKSPEGLKFFYKIGDNSQQSN